MPVTLTDDLARFDGHCTVEEAETLLEWLRATPDAAVDLARCEALHASLAQLILAARPRFVALPADPVLAAAFAAPSLPMQVSR